MLSFEDLSELHQGNIPPRIAKEHKDLLWAEGLVFIYPLWWLTPPAILKGWFDVVLNQGVAFESSQQGNVGLLKHKKAQVLITAGASEEYFVESDSLEMSYKPLTEFTLGFCGIKNVSHKIHHNIFSKTDEERANLLNEAKEIGINF